MVSKLDEFLQIHIKNGAASVIRTRDLTLTKGALYRWSYGSISIDAPDLHEITRPWQAGFCLPDPALRALPTRPFQQTRPKVPARIVPTALCAG